MDTDIECDVNRAYDRMISDHHDGRHEPREPDCPLCERLDDQ